MRPLCSKGKYTTGIVSDLSTQNSLPRRMRHTWSPGFSAIDLVSGELAHQALRTDTN